MTRSSESDVPESYEDLLVETEHGTRYRTLAIDESGEVDARDE